MTFLEIIAAGPYNVAFAVALITGLTLAVRGARADNHPRLAWAVLITAGVTFGLIGSKFIIFDFQAAEYGEKSNLGGILAGVAAVLVVARALGLSALKSLDTLTIPTLTAMAIGRVGCFLAGCCRGTLTSLPWGVHYDGDARAVHPVQLYESVADVLLIAVLTRLAPQRTGGQRFGMAVAGYAAIRFSTEFLREGRESIGWLNPVQWSVLAIGASVALWTMWRTRRTALPLAYRNATASNPARAMTTAVVVASLLVILPLVFTATFTPLERVTLVVASAALFTYVIALRLPRTIAARLAPSLGAVLLVQQPQQPPPQQQKSEGPRTEIIAGGSFWSAAYDKVVGKTPASTYTDACGGLAVQGGDPIWAGRESEVTRVSVGIRQRTSSGDHVTLEGQMLFGRDRVTFPPTQTTYIPKYPTSFRFTAGGASGMYEGRNSAAQLGFFGGTMSEQGERSSGPAMVALIRGGSESGFFVEGKYADEKWFSTLGETSYLGIGYVLSEQGGRIVLGAGKGGYLGLHLPLRGFEFDLGAHGSMHRNEEFSSRGWWTFGLKHRFAIR